jgi:hypothetical protein
LGCVSALVQDTHDFGGNIVESIKYQVRTHGCDPDSGHEIGPLSPSRRLARDLVCRALKLNQQIVRDIERG